MSIHTGMRVVCVYDGGTDLVAKGSVYLVLDTGLSPVLKLPTISGRPVSGGQSFTGMYTSRFRPLVERKTDISIFTAMLTPSPVTVDAMKLADHAREIVG